MGDVVSIFTAEKATCLCCKDVLRIPGFPLDDKGLCGLCSTCVIDKETL